MEAQNVSDAAAYVRYRQSGSDGLVSKNPIYIQGWKRVGAKIYSLKRTHTSNRTGAVPDVRLIPESECSNSRE